MAIISTWRALLAWALSLGNRGGGNLQVSHWLNSLIKPLNIRLANLPVGEMMVDGFADVPARGDIHALPLLPEWISSFHIDPVFVGPEVIFADWLKGLDLGLQLLGDVVETALEHLRLMED